MIVAGSIDAFLDELAHAIVSSVPGVARSLYLTGSQVRGDAVATSDVDVCAIVEESAQPRDIRRIVHVARAHAAARGRRLDLAVLRASDLPKRGARIVAMRLGGRHFYGVDIAELAPLPDLDDYVASRMDDAACLVAFALRAPRIELPLTYPNADDELFGYAREAVPRMRDAVTIAGWAVTALTALRHRVYVASKAEALAAYARSGAPFADLVSALATRCRAAWAYGVPDGADRVALRAICAELLAFERYFLEIYGEHLASRLSAGVCANVPPVMLVERALHAMLE